MRFFPSVWCVLLLCMAVLTTFSVSVSGLTQAALRCSPGYAPSLTACRLPSVQGTPVAGKGTCCSCPGGSISDGTACKRCVNGLVAQHGVDLQHWGGACSCIAGYGDYDSTTGTCRRCPSNTYSSATLPNRCLPCSKGTFAAPQSSSCAAVVCPADSYLPPGGSTLADCTRCKFGTAGQSCTTVQGCRCLQGYAGFNNQTGQCKQCTSFNSIAVYADMSKQDETETVCAECPVGTAPANDRRKCEVPVRAGGTSGSGGNNIGTTTPFPQVPIPALQCTVPNSDCDKNGYDITLSFGNTDPAKSVAVTVSHTDDVFSAASYADSLFEDWVSNNLGSFILVDSDNNLAIGLVNVYRSFFALFGHNYVNLYPYVGFTCDQINSLTNLAYPCIAVKRSSSPISINSQLNEKGYGVRPGSDITVSQQCGSEPKWFQGCPSGFDSDFILVDSRDTDIGIELYSSQLTDFAAVSNGDGSSKFGTKVIGFVDVSNVVQFVMAQHPSSIPQSIYLSSDATLFPTIIGQQCTVGTIIAACVQLTNQWIHINDIMNSVSAGAAGLNNNYMVNTACYD